MRATGVRRNTSALSVNVINGGDNRQNHELRQRRPGQPVHRARNVHDRPDGTDNLSSQWLRAATIPALNSRVYWAKSPTCMFRKETPGSTRRIPNRPAAIVNANRISALVPGGGRIPTAPCSRATPLADSGVSQGKDEEREAKPQRPVLLENLQIRDVCHHSCANESGAVHECAM